MAMSEDRSEIAFFDLETTIPTRPGQGYSILEFGAILVCPKKLVELDNYSTLVRPSDLSRFTAASIRCNGITAADVTPAPTFSQIADRVYDILHGRIWAGHNILRFDCPRLREAFAEINRPPPEPKGTIDSLTLLTQKFGRRAGDMKMATLATYFGIGQQTHRSLDDVRMNLEVLKYCATVLFLESSLPDVFMNNATGSSNNGNASPLPNMHFRNQHTSPPSDHNHTPIQPDSFNTVPLQSSIDIQTMESEPESPSNPSPLPSIALDYEPNNFLGPNEVSIPSMTAVLVTFYRGSQRVQIVHNEVPLKLYCNNPPLKVRFGVSTKFVNSVGRPRLSFVVDASADMCRVLDACDNLAQRSYIDSGSNSEWRPVVARKPGFWNNPTIRLHIPTAINGRWTTEIYEKEQGNMQKLVFSRYEIEEIDGLLSPGSLVEAYFSLDTYDYQQSAGIRLVAHKLVICSNN
jgi:DNA polymerase III epsilon subunit-like protein